jgi:hypothetical protein
MHEETDLSYGTCTLAEKPWKLHSIGSQEAEGRRSCSYER